MNTDISRVAQIVFILFMAMTQRYGFCSVVQTNTNQTALLKGNEEMKLEITMPPNSDVNRALSAEPLCGTVLVYYGNDIIFNTTTQLRNREELFSVIGNTTRNLWIENGFILEGTTVGDNCGYNLCGLSQGATTLPCEQRSLITEVGFDPKLVKTTVTCLCGDPDCLTSTCGNVRLEPNECARLYTETQCQECYSESVRMPRILSRVGPSPFFSEFTSKGHFIKSVVVNEGCEVWIEDSTVVHGHPLTILKPGPTNALTTLNEKKNILFKCFNIQSPSVAVPTEFDEENTDRNSSFEGIIIAVTAIVVLLFLGIGIFLARRKCANSQNKKVKINLQEGFLGIELEEFFNGKPATSHYKNIGFENKTLNTKISKAENDEAIDNALLQAYQWKWEIPRKRIRKSLKLLGNGQFGQVFEGNLDREGEVSTNDLVAIKEAHGEFIKPLLMEIKILSYIGRHPNIVNMLGASVSQLKKGISNAWLILELCANGSLKSYLHKARPRQTTLELSSDDISTGHFNETSSVEPLSRRNLCTWSLEIALGMEYLERKKILHIDLAARNVLLDANLVAKVSDFGSSRKSCSEGDYWKRINPADGSTKEPLACKWMALESLQLLIFTSKSDVWSFGVTIWEIFEYGKEPYAQVDNYERLTASLQYGLRLSQPEAADNHIYEIMRRCWDRNPDSRPTFADLQAYFQDLLELDA